MLHHQLAVNQSEVSIHHHCSDINQSEHSPVADLLASLQSSLAQPHSRLQLIVLHTVITEQEEEILFITFNQSEVSK